MQARVVVLGEAHADCYVSSWQIQILADLVQRWMSDAVVLVYETPMKERQGAVLAAARFLGIKTTAVEEEHPTRQSVHRRDDEAKERMFELLSEDPSRRLVVVYGEAHRESFVRSIRAEGIAAVGVSLCGSGEMHADAMRTADTLAVRDRIFRYDNGTFYVAAIPYAGRGCTALDVGLDDRARRASP